MSAYGTCDYSHSTARFHNSIWLFYFLRGFLPLTELTSETVGRDREWRRRTHGAHLLGKWWLKANLRGDSQNKRRQAASRKIDQFLVGNHLQPTAFTTSTHVTSGLRWPLYTTLWGRGRETSKNVRVEVGGQRDFEEEEQKEQ